MGSDGSWGSIEGKELEVGACKWVVRCEWACVGGVMRLYAPHHSSATSLRTLFTKNGLIDIMERV